MLSERDNEAEEAAEAEEAEEGQREEERRVEETEAGDTVAEHVEPGEEVNEGITTLMAACQQGLEHDVRSILRR